MVLKWSLQNHEGWCAKNRCEMGCSNCFYLWVIDYKRLDTSLYLTKRWSRMGSLRQFRWFVLKCFFGLYSKYFINLKSLQLGGHCPRCPPLSTTVLWLQATDRRRNSWLSEVYVHTDLVIQINQHNYQKSWQFSLHSKSVHCVHRLSSDNVHFIYLFLGFMLGKRFQQ